VVHVPVPEERPLEEPRQVREENQERQAQGKEEDGVVASDEAEAAGPDPDREPGQRKSQDDRHKERDNDLEHRPAGPLLAVERGPQEDQPAERVADGARHAPAKRKGTDYHWKYEIINLKSYPRFGIFFLLAKRQHQDLQYIVIMVSSSLWSALGVPSRKGPPGRPPRRARC
jgi:hypothetical protein